MKNVLIDVREGESTEALNIKKWEVAFKRTESALKILYAKGYPCAELLLESLKTLDGFIAGMLPASEASRLLEVSAHYLRRARRSRALVKALRNPSKASDTAVCSLIKRAVGEIDDALGLMARTDLANSGEKEKISNQLISALFSLVSAEMQSRELCS